MTCSPETSGREKVLEALTAIKDAALTASGMGVALYSQDILDNANKALRALASPSTPEPALRGGKVEEIAVERRMVAGSSAYYVVESGNNVHAAFTFHDGDDISRAIAGTKAEGFKLGMQYQRGPDKLAKTYVDNDFAALRCAGESAAQSEPVPDASMTNADWLRAISAWVPQYADHLGEAADELNELCSERDQLTEQLAIRSESGMAKDMQEIRRIDNELQKRIGETERRHELTERDACEWAEIAGAHHRRAEAAEQALTAERQRREAAEKVALPLSQGWQSYGGIEKDKAGLLRGTLAIWDFENAAKHFSRYAHANEPTTHLAQEPTP